MDLFESLKNAPIWSASKSFKRGEYLSEAGKYNSQVYWVQEGLFRIYQVEADQEYTNRFAYEGDIFSALDSYIHSEPSRFYIQSLRASKVVVCSKAALEGALNESPALKTQWLQGLYQLVYDLLEREQDLMISNPKKRLQRVLQRSPQLFQHVPHKYIASYLRMSPETLSRLLNS